MAAGRILPTPYMPARDRYGNLVPGAKMYVWENRTTTVAEIYSDYGLATPAPNPVVADSSGRFPTVFAEAGGPSSQVLYTLKIVGPTGESIGNPSVFDDWLPDVYYSGGPGYPSSDFGREWLNTPSVVTARDLLGGTTIGKGVWLASTSTIALTALGASSPGRGVVQAVSEAAGRSSIGAAGQDDLNAALARIATLEAGGGTGLPGDGLAKLGLLLDEAQGWVGVEPTEIIQGQFARSSNSAPLLPSDTGFQMHRFRLPAGSDKRKFRAAGNITNNPAQAAVVVHTTAGAFVAPYGVGASGDGLTAAPFANVEFSPPSSACDVYVTSYSTEFGRRPPPIVLQRLDAVDGDVVRETVTREALFEQTGWDWQRVEPVETAAAAYLYLLKSGQSLGPQDDQQWAKFAVTPGRAYRITAEVQSSGHAGAVEYDAGGVFLTSQFKGPTSLTAQTVTFNPLTRTVGITSEAGEPLLLEIWAPLAIDQDHEALKGWVPLTPDEIRPGEFVKAFKSPGTQFGALDLFYSQGFALTGVEAGAIRIRTSKVSSADLKRAVYLMDDETFVSADATPIVAGEPYLDAPLVLTPPAAAQMLWVTGDDKSVIEVERYGLIDDAGQRLADLKRTVTSLGLADLSGVTLGMIGHSYGSGGPPQGDYVTLGGLRAGCARVFNLANGNSRMASGYLERKTPGVTIDTANPATQDPLGIWGTSAFGTMTSIGLTPTEKQWIIDNWTAIRPRLTNHDGATGPELDPFWIAIFLQSCLENLVDTLVVENGAGIIAVEGPANDFRFDLNDIDPAQSRADLMRGIDSGSRDRTCWAGVMNCLVDQVLAANRRCWIVLMEDSRTGGFYDVVREAQAAWAAKNPHVLFCPMGSKLGWSYDVAVTELATTRSLASWAFGGGANGHPHDNPNPASIEQQRMRFSRFLIDNCHAKA